MLKNYGIKMKLSQEAEMGKEIERQSKLAWKKILNGFFGATLGAIPILLAYFLIPIIPEELCNIAGRPRDCTISIFPYILLAIIGGIAGWIIGFSSDEDWENFSSDEDWENSPQKYKKMKCLRCKVIFNPAMKGQDMCMNCLFKTNEFK